METIKILGTKITALGSYEGAYNRLKSIIGTPCYVTVNNVHTVVESVLDEKYREIIYNSSLSLPDGKPLSIYAKIKGAKNISRIFGPTFLEKTLEWGEKEDLKHFFFGSTEETLSKMLEVVKNKYPTAVIRGKLSPPFREFTKEENELFIKQMNENCADIFWIGLGAPKQELWMYENYKKLNKGVMIGIGAGFDYLAGNTKHAPEWMKNMALEWLYRLIQEPKRLWKRYLVTNILFLWFVFLEMTGIRDFNKYNKPI
jgi:N-acetylglucosaminyldiphosphoundecaprenol N-acetyl-beta-D-mannosaminyltransferase